MMTNFTSFLRYNLIAPNVEQYVVSACINFLYGNIRFLAVNVGIIFLATVAIFYNSVNQLYLMVWSVLVILILVMRLVLLFVYKHVKPPESEAIRWGNYFTFSAALSGWSWALAIFLFFDAGTWWQKTYIAMITLGMGSGAMSMTSSWPPAYHHFILPQFGMVFFELATGLDEASISLAVVTFLYCFGIIRVGRHHFRFFVDAVKLRNLNVDLVNQLREQKDKAEDANRSKTQFLASASHDLRQPVHALALFADALKHEVQTPKGKSLMGNLTRSVESIDELLSSLLDISKLDAGAIKVNKADVALEPIMQKIYNDFHREAEGKNLKFSVPSTSLSVHSDPVLLTNIIRNLVGNALRYTPDGGITVVCRRKNYKISIEIWDTGYGIPDDEQEKIFGEFYQLHNPERDRGKGLGLGLAICYRTCQLLKHELKLQSRYGRGSVFKIIVPECKTIISRTESKPTTATAMEENPVIMVVDDEKNILSAMEAVLETWDCRVLSATSGKKAVKMIRDNPDKIPALLICDYRLGEGEIGTEVVANIQSLLGKKIPAIIMTGDTAPENIRNAETSGNSLLHKPVKPMELHRMIIKLLGK